MQTMWTTQVLSGKQLETKKKEKFIFVPVVSRQNISLLYLDEREREKRGGERKGERDGWEAKQ